MKKSMGKSHIVKRMPTFDQAHKNKGMKPFILSHMNPIPEPAILTIKKALKSNKLDATVLRFNPPPPPEE